MEWQRQLGDLYTKGSSAIGVVVDWPLGLSWLRRAQGQGDLAATRLLGDACSAGGPGPSAPKDWAAAAAAYGVVATTGDRPAMVALGRMLRRGGHGLAPDPEAAFGWLSSALEGQEPLQPPLPGSRALCTLECAQVRRRLGDCHYWGLGTAVDRKRARGRYTEAAGLDTKAAFRLGAMLLRGEGGARSRSHGLELWEVAATAGMEEATAALAAIDAAGSSTNESHGFSL